jgi:DNA processing protein
MNSEPEANFRTVSERDPDYPKKLLELADRPPVLYIRGRWPLPEQCVIGVVGTRRASSYGLEVASRLTSDLVGRNVVTVSGLAAGIDACAHRTTIEEGGWTVAVLGHGFGFQYPKENALLYDEIARKGTLVTEFSYDTRPQPRYFPQRNRIISGLSQGVLVIEAGERSGALITARFAAEQGRDVFVVPGSIFSPWSAGCHRLIKEGARLVESADEILEEYGFERHENEAPPPSTSGEEDLSSPEKDVLKLMSSVPLSVDELVELSGRAVDSLAEVLLSLEIKGRIQHRPGQCYVAKN